MQDFCPHLKEDCDTGAVFYPAGSGAENLIVQNASLQIDLDYNPEIVRCEDSEDCGFIKKCAGRSCRVFDGCLYCLQRYKGIFVQTETQEDRILFEHYNIPTVVMHITRLSSKPGVTQTGLERMKRLVDFSEKKKINLALENLDSIQHLKIRVFGFLL